MGEGVYAIQNLGTERYLNVDGGSSDKGTNAIVSKTDDASCHFEVKKVLGDVYTLQSVKTKKFLTVKPDGSKENGENVVMWDKVPESKWKIVRADPDDASCTLVSETSDKRLNVDEGTFNVVIGVRPDDDEMNALWEFVKVQA